MNASELRAWCVHHVCSARAMALQCVVIEALQARRQRVVIRMCACMRAHACMCMHVNH
jgi:hypothetical protein